MKLLRPCLGFAAVLALAGSLLAQSASGLPKGKVELFLLAGQSNMAGRGAVADLAPADAAADPRVWALNKDGAWQPAMDPLHWDKAGSGVGSGKFFGRIIAAKKPGVIVALIPTACGGSPIGTWVPGAYWEQTKSHPWDDSIARAKRALQDGGTLKAVLWHQGESDSNAKNAPLYEKNLTDLINRFRKEFNAPELPFIIGQLGRFDAEGKPWGSGQIEVDRAQRAVAAKMPHVYFVSAEGLVSKGDKLHFSTASQKTLAEHYAEAYLKSQSAR
ncbi:MAG: sialate O-acetylesterase [Rariglobus sp.]|nr:sialate O-acetylesterase [Rariglobus sp.]